MTGFEAREIREKLGLNQNTVAIAIGISDVSLRYFEQGARKLNELHQEMLEKYLKEKQGK